MCEMISVAAFAPRPSLSRVACLSAFCTAATEAALVASLTRSKAVRATFPD